MKVGVVSYGMGNLGSVTRALEVAGHQPIHLTQPSELLDLQRVVLPGVGAFAEAMKRIRTLGWDTALQAFADRSETKLLGICLGMQLLATRGTEHEEARGLGLIDGSALHLRSFGVSNRIPHVGWNIVEIERPDPIFSGIESGTDFYFVHSFAFDVADANNRLANTLYDTKITAMVRHRNVYGAQFHPEKSSRAGMCLLKNFVEQDIA